jgi:hypothetical protein
MSDQPITSLATIQTNIPLQPVSMEAVVSQIAAIEQCIKSVMKKDLHYGLVPGCGDKPTLLKPGAEMLAKLFNIRPEFTRNFVDLPDGHIRVMSSCVMYSRVSGLPVGEGAGSCSSMESKYRHRKGQRSCPKCGIESSIMRSKFPPRDNPNAEPGWYCRECKSQFDYGAPEIRNQKVGNVPNPDIADTYNTVQKMADKRAYVAAVITTVGASDFVTQDIEDFAEYSAPAVQPAAEPVPAPRAAPKAAQAPQQGAEPGICTVTGLVDGCLSKATQNGSTRYGIKINDLYYNTFDSKVNAVAVAAKAGGYPVRIDYIEGRYGKDIEQIVPVGDGVGDSNNGLEDQGLPF